MYNNDDFKCINCGEESIAHCACEDDMIAECKKCGGQNIKFCKAELMEWGYAQQVFCNNARCNGFMWLDQ